VVFVADCALSHHFVVILSEKVCPQR
jgi:hypothetical protein